MYFGLKSCFPSDSLLYFNQLTEGGSAMSAPLNFTEYGEEKLLASGGKPDSDSKLDWLISQGFMAIVSLDLIPDNITKRILSLPLSYCLKETDEDDDPPIKETADFIASHILYECRVFVHCDAGITRSPRLIRAFIHKQDFYITKYLGRRANDLNHGDGFDWMRGHNAFYGERLLRSVSFLEKTLVVESNEIRLEAAKTLIELMEHIDHGCFDASSFVKLRELKEPVFEIAFRLNPTYAKNYQEILVRLRELGL